MTYDDLWLYRARPQRTVDGDTIYFLVDLGMFVHSTQSVRIRGVDTPELFSGEDRVRGAEARDFTAGWLEEHDHLQGDWPYLIRTEKDRRSFNRYVADVTCSEGHDLATAIREAGYSA